MSRARRNAASLSAAGSAMSARIWWVVGDAVIANTCLQRGGWQANKALEDIMGWPQSTLGNRSANSMRRYARLPACELRLFVLRVKEFNG